MTRRPTAAEVARREELERVRAEVREREAGLLTQRIRNLRAAYPRMPQSEIAFRTGISSHLIRAALRDEPSGPWPCA